MQWCCLKERNEAVVHFAYMDREQLPALAESLFVILAGNMSLIAPTGNSREADFALWRGAVADGLRDERRKIVLMLSEDEQLVGYFQYSVDGTLFMMEDMQLSAPWHGKGRIFRRIYEFVIPQLSGIETVEAHADKRNAKSWGILERLGLRIVGENRSGRSYHFRGPFSMLLAWLGGEVVGCEVVRLPKLLIVGKMLRHSDEGLNSGDNHLPAFWDECESAGIFAPLMAQTAFVFDESPAGVFLDWDLGDGQFGYVVGMLMVEGAAVPEGYFCRELPEADALHCGIKGRDIAERRAAPFDSVARAIEGIGRSCAGMKWCADMYHPVRSTVPDEDGLVALDCYIPLDE